MDSLPVIDISPYLNNTEKKQEVVEAWYRAFNTVGFATIVGHGVPDEVVENAERVAREFFSLPLEVKTKSSHTDIKSAGSLGYVPFGLEMVSGTTTPDGAEIKSSKRSNDLVESIGFRRTEADFLPDTPKNFTQEVYTYWDHMLKLLQKIMEISAVSLGLHEDYFVPYYKEPRTFLKFAHYPPVEKEPEPGQMRYGEHTDFIGFTILKQDVSAGAALQVKFPDGKWVDCEPVPGSFVINAGDLIQIWTNDLFLSNWHRVKNPEGSFINRSRLSIVYFTGPKVDSMIECLPTCCSPTNPPKYKPVKERDHLANKMNKMWKPT